MKKLFKMMIVFLLTFVLVGCINNGTNTATDNTSPVANAGADQGINTGSIVTLDGSGSTDADGDPLTYNWTIVTAPSGSTASLSDETAVKPTFIPDEDGTYEITLVVNDGMVDSASDSVSIVATTLPTNSTPVANAGVDQNVNTGTTVTLNGSGSTDADGDALTYSWDMTTKPADSSTALSNANTVSPTFVANKDGDYVVQLIVNDATVDSTPDTVTVTSATAGPITGVPDTSFNGTGYVTAGDDFADRGYSIVSDNIGNVYVTGYASVTTTNRDMVLGKFKSDGTPDTTFATDGVVFEHNASGGNGNDEGRAVVLDSSGNIYVVGGSKNTSNTFDMVIWKYKSDGAPDTTFGVDGIVTYPAGPYSIAGQDITLDSTGTIYVTGIIRTVDNYMAVWKYDSNGTLDTTFDNDGVLLYDSVRSGGNGIQLDSNNNIYVTGFTLNSTNNRIQLAVWKMDNNGTADTTFSGDGIAVYNFGTTDYAENGADIALDSSNNIYVTGTISDFNSHSPAWNYMCLLKFNSNGNLNSTFGDNGLAINYNTAGVIGRDSGSGIVWDGSGKVYVTGTSTSPSESAEMVIWKYHDSNGTLDTTFDLDGIVIAHTVSGAIDDAGSDITLDNSGKVFVTGHSDYDVAIWKYK